MNTENEVNEQVHPHKPYQAPHGSRITHTPEDTEYLPWSSGLFSQDHNMIFKNNHLNASKSFLHTIMHPTKVRLRSQDCQTLGIK